jgi:hypothetical protein
MQISWACLVWGRLFSLGKDLEENFGGLFHRDNKCRLITKLITLKRDFFIVA